MTALSTTAETSEVIALDAEYLRMKRSFDVVFTLLIAPFLLLVCTVVALCIKLESKGPILFRQKRMGQHGKEFELLKFRSMYHNSDEQVHRAAVTKYMKGERLSDGSEDTYFKQTIDPRITRVGRFIRRTSLDELPQFLNVLLGQMTLVGPRPPMSYEVEMYSSRDWLRLSGKPGLTGTWQVYGRSRVSFQTMVEMDIAYLQRQSCWQDIKLILLTIPVMFLSRGGA